MNKIKIRVYNTRDKRWMNDDEWKGINNFGLYMNDEDDLSSCDHAIIQQWTGFIDINGKEIYDGDLILGDTYGPYPVFWKNGAWRSSCYDDYDLINGYSTIEVVGNILDNPEWIKSND